MARVVIIGLGQAAAGDDGVGAAVVDALRDAPLPAGVELVAARDATELVELLRGAGRAILVDAAIGAGPPGSVRLLSPDGLATLPSHPLSSHGFGVREALELACAVTDAAGCRISIVAVCIEAPRRYERGLSPAVRAAVTRARQLVLSCVQPEGLALEAP